MAARRFDAGYFLPIDSQTGEPLAAPGSGLRPSIETRMHLALPHAVIIHVHSVNALAWAVRHDGRQQLASRLAGFDWQWIPYVMPGDELAASIRAARVIARPDVFVLENHGLVVAAETVEQAQNLLSAVEERVKTPARTFHFASPSKLAQIIEETGWRLPVHPEVHALAMDDLLQEIARGGVLYPDHAVFLGASPVVRRGEQSLGTLLENHKRRTGQPASFMLAEGDGVLVRPDLSSSADEMLRCLLLVASRVTQGASLKYLSRSDIDALLAWDGEKFRQTVSQ